MRSIAILLAALALTACPLHNPVPVEPDYPPGSVYPSDGGLVEMLPEGSDAAAASPCGRACSNITRLGCEEGGPRCYRACVARAELVIVPTGCWAHAEDVEELRTCGGVRCR